MGDNSKVAAGAVLLEPLEENSTAVGVPARAVRVAGKKVDNTLLDQVHIPDPVSQELCRMMMKIEKLERRIQELEEEKK